MKLSVYYESNFKRDYTWLDVGDEDLSVMVENDYQDRLAKAKDGEIVERRDPQEILDETSREIYNSAHRDDRRSVVFSAYDPYGKLARGGEDPELTYIEKEEIDELHAALKQIPARQRKLLKKLFWDELSQREVADAEGVRENSLSDRKKRALAALKKILEKV